MDDDNVFDNDCLDACTSTHLQCMRTCPCLIVGDCPLGCPCPSFSCIPACEVEVDIDPAQENKLKLYDIRFCRLMNESRSLL